ncbi:hypothetical protein ACLOJK_036553 [Asimina triloba]
MPIPKHLLFILLLFLPPLSSAQTTTTHQQLQTFTSFNASSFQTFSIEGDAMVNGGALQITPDTQNDDFVRVNRSGRVLLKQPFQLWQTNHPNSPLASFNSSFLVNIYRPNNETAGEGIAFIIAPNLNQVPHNSQGQWLGLTNATTDGNASNHFIAVELDTVKQSFDINDNHIGLDINSVESVEARNLSALGIQLAPEIPANYSVWVEYNGTSMNLSIYIAEEHLPKPPNPIIQRKINLTEVLNQQSYFGFAASTGSNAQLNCVLRWSLSVEIFPSEEDDESGKALLAVAIVVPVVVVGLLGGVLGWLLIRRRRMKEDPAILGTLKSLPGMPREFEFRDLKRATNNFDEKQKLGQGGFGIVYKGVLAEESKAVAVKMFSRENMKGKDDFLAELTIINRLRHKHLVRLVGWCHKKGMLLLVYDFMPNGSLDDHLFGSSGNEKVLSWDRRRNVLVGVASALHYLHDEYDQKVVHRDLKASNVLLDSDFNARLGDFGLARALDNEKTSYAELEGVPGTIGYIAPECFHTGKATRESDVYGFGAVVLEVVCGQRPRANIEGFQFLVDWVWLLYREGRILEAVDARLGESYVGEEAEKLLLLGLACSHPAPSERPKTPAIVQILSGSVPVPYVPPLRPAFVWPSAMSSFSDVGLGLATSESTPMNTSSYCGSGWTPRLDSQESSSGV